MRGIKPGSNGVRAAATAKKIDRKESKRFIISVHHILPGLPNPGT
jgi:hypothetical protein